MIDLQTFCNQVSSLSPLQLQNELGVNIDRTGDVSPDTRTISFRFFNGRPRIISFTFNFTDDSMSVIDEGRAVDGIKTIEDVRKLFNSVVESQ